MGAGAADAVAEQAHDGDVEREAKQAQQGGLDARVGFGWLGVGWLGFGWLGCGRGWAFSQSGLWREGDWGFPDGCGFGHFHFSF
jgi:hypothetical protein